MLGYFFLSGMMYCFQALTASSGVMPWMAGSRKVNRCLGLVLATSDARVLRFLKLKSIACQYKSCVVSLA